MKLIKLMKIASALCGIIAVLGFFYMLGSIGALDNNSIGLAQGFRQCFVGIGALVVGTIGAGLLSNEAEYRERCKK